MRDVDDPGVCLLPARPPPGLSSRPHPRCPSPASDPAPRPASPGTLVLPPPGSAASGPRVTHRSSPVPPSSPTPTELRHRPPETEKTPRGGAEPIKKQCWEETPTVYPDQAGSRRTGARSPPGAQPPRFSEGVRGLVHTAVSWGLRARAGSPDGSAWAGPRGGAPDRGDAVHSLPGGGGGGGSEPSEAGAAARRPLETRRSPQPPPTASLHPPPSGVRSRLPKSTRCQWALPDSQLSPAVPSRHQQDAQVWGPGRGLGQHRPMGPPCCPRSGLGGWGQAVARALPAGGHTPSLPTSSSETEQRSEDKSVSSGFRHKTRSKRLGMPSPPVRLAAWRPCRPRYAPQLRFLLPPVLQTKLRHRDLGDLPDLSAAWPGRRTAQLSPQS
ncbi:splicing factor 3A subunit 2-like [Odocoileus virginianus]|uniref:Splicing factor 3A subunit 2-like n=1 Tax=Odocoileus virginianus TaxID=9874 RepID=A0ABM4H9J9_ODOVR